VWDLLLSHPVAISILFIFLSAVIVSFIAARKRDRCLKKFNKNHVAIELQDGQKASGILKLLSKGLIVLYPEPGPGQGEGRKSSRLLYEADMKQLLTVVRFFEQLSKRGARKRQKQICKLGRPNLIRRTVRGVRNIISTLRDALVKALGVLLGQAQKATPSGQLVSRYKTDVSSLSTTFLGEAANAYEPLLEYYIGKPVILELRNPADAEAPLQTFHGRLGEYSAQYLLILDCEYALPDQPPAPADLVVPRTAGIIRHGGL